jgi:uncharacterized membrane protein HdeD (DUF308 family)
VEIKFIIFIRRRKNSMHVFITITLLIFCSGCVSGTLNSDDPSQEIGYLLGIALAVISIAFVWVM